MIAGELRTMPMHELRDKGRLAVAYAEAGTPVMVFTHGDPSAVLIADDEAVRWIAIERALAALHGLDVYPDLAEDTATLSGIVAGRERPKLTAVRRLAREPRQILDIPRTARTPRSSAGWPRSSTKLARAGRPRSTPRASSSVS